MLRLATLAAALGLIAAGPALAQSGASPALQNGPSGIYAPLTDQSLNTPGTPREQQIGQAPISPMKGLTECAAISDPNDRLGCRLRVGQAPVGGGGPIVGPPAGGTLAPPPAPQYQPLPQ